MDKLLSPWNFINDIDDIKRIKSIVLCIDEVNNPKKDLILPLIQLYFRKSLVPRISGGYISVWGINYENCTCELRLSFCNRCKAFMWGTCLFCKYRIPCKNTLTTVFLNE